MLKGSRSDAEQEEGRRIMMLMMNIGVNSGWDTFWDTSHLMAKSVPI